MRRKIKKASKEAIQKIARISLNDVDRKIETLTKQIQVLAVNHDSLRKKNDVLQKKLDRVIGHKTVYIREGLTMVRLLDGARIYVDPEDQDIGAYVAIHGFWEPHIEDIWRSLVKDGDIIFDVGANFGYFSAIAARKIKTGHIYLFEANDKFEPYLTKTMSSNGFANRSTVVSCAVGDVRGTQTLRETQNFWGRSTMTQMSMGEKGSAKVVDIITLDEYCSDNDIRKIDLIKMDIEGYEEKAFKGMTNILANNKQLKIALEFSANHYNDPKAFYKSLKSSFKYIYIFDISRKLVRCSKYTDIEKGKVGSNTMLLVSNHKVA